MRPHIHTVMAVTACRLHAVRSFPCAPRGAAIDDRQNRRHDSAPRAARANCRKTAGSHGVSQPQSSVMALLLAAAAAVACAAGSASAAPLLPLRFRADGTFKVLTFSDTHYTRNAHCKCAPVLPCPPLRSRTQIVLRRAPADSLSAPQGHLRGSAEVPLQRREQHRLYPPHGAGGGAGPGCLRRVRTCLPVVRQLFCTEQ
jgi:hypothetical protein